ncbi:MAG: serine hydrolase [Acidobacteriota bacterium]|jgi:beta-lactamase class A
MRTSLFVGLFLTITAMAVATQSTPQSSPAAQSHDLQNTAEAVAKYFRADPSGIDQLFAPEFLVQVPAARLERVMRQLFSQYGGCTGVKLEKQVSPTGAHFQFTFEKGFTVPVSLEINDNAAHTITGFVLGAPVSSSETLSSVIDKMKALPGQVSFLAQRLDASGPVALAEWQPAQELGIGSAFKLYILGALAQQISAGRRHWNDVIPLETQSLPSGILQKWPLGTPLTVQSLASLMISISDNTAADALLKAVGREQVEAILPVMGHSQPALDQPFLATMDMFQLKWGIPAEQLQQYLADDTAARRAFLQTMKPPASTAALIAAVSTTTPKMIDNVEWFASAIDLCHAMAWFRADDTARNTARQVLAINPGLALSSTRWAYIGFKGGSEPGVISLNLLLRSQSGQWYVVSGVWNNPKAAVSETEWVSLVSRAIDLLQ